MTEKSIYKKIKENIDDGRLPETFNLEKDLAPNQINFAPGAMDGIGIYHSAQANEEKIARKIGKLLRKYFKTSNVDCLNKVEAVLDENRAISIIDLILQDFIDNQNKIDCDKAVELSYTLIKTSDSLEMVKIGIGVLGLFDLDSNTEIMETIITLGIYDDLTLYAVVAASNWANGNEIIFKIAKSVHGWGKVHAVDRLEPETEEIREWILREGCVGMLAEMYLGLTCAVKGNMIGELRKETISRELFDGIATTISSLLDEGPVAGISEYEYAEEALVHFIKHARQHSDHVEHLWRILNLRDWVLSVDGSYEEILSQINEIVEGENWSGKIIFALRKRDKDYEFYYAFNAASRLEIDISSEIFSAIKENPFKYSSYLNLIFENPEMANEIIDLYEEILPLEDMSDGMGDYLFADRLNEEHQSFGFVLSGLGLYPLKGIRLVRAGLNSRVIRERNMACRILADWIEKEGKSLEEILPEIHRELKGIYEIEINEETKGNMKKLLRCR